MGRKERSTAGVVLFCSDFCIDTYRYLRIYHRVNRRKSKGPLPQSGMNVSKAKDMTFEYLAF